jgi:hypothetical protein
MSDNVSTLRNMAASNWAARYEWADELTAAADEIERLISRLEIDPRHAYDGIDSRDETIRLQGAQIDKLSHAARYWNDLAELAPMDIATEVMGAKDGETLLAGLQQRIDRMRNTAE